MAVRCVGALMSNTTSGEPASASAWHWHRQGSSPSSQPAVIISRRWEHARFASLLPMNLESATTSVTLRTWTSAVDSGPPSSPRSWCCRLSWKYRRCRVRADRPPFASAARSRRGVCWTALHCTALRYCHCSPSSPPTLPPHSIKGVRALVSHQGEQAFRWPHCALHCCAKRLEHRA